MPDEEFAPDAPIVAPGAEEDLTPDAPVVPPVAASAAPDDSILHRVGSALHGIKNKVIEYAKPVGESFANLGKSAGRGVNFVASMASPDITVNPIGRSIANRNLGLLRQAQRGIVGAVPYGNELVSSAPGQIPAHSDLDAAQYPGAEEAFSVVGNEMAGGALGKIAETVAPAVSNVARSFVSGQAEREVGRGVGAIEEGATKRAKAGLEKGKDAVADLVREDKGVAKAAGSDEALRPETARVHENARKKMAKAFDDFEKNHPPASPPKAPREAPTSFDEVGDDPGYTAADREGLIKQNPATASAGPVNTHETVGGATVAGPRKPSPAPLPSESLHSKAMSNLDDKIASLRKGGPNDYAAAKKLESIKQDFVSQVGAEGIDLHGLRKYQSDYQGNSFGKGLTPDDTTVKLANKAAHEAMGDTIAQRMTGKKYVDAKLAVEKRQIEAPEFEKYLKAKREATAAHRIDAAIKSREGKTPKPGVAQTIGNAVKHSATAAIFGGAHGGVGGAGLGVAGQVVAEHLPAAAGAVVRGADKLLAGIAQRIVSGSDATQAIAAARSAGVSPERIGHLVRSVARIRSLRPGEEAQANVNQPTN